MNYTKVIMVLIAIVCTNAVADMDIVSRWTVYETNEPCDVSFAYLAKTESGDLFMGFNIGKHPDSEVWKSFASLDSGLSWAAMTPVVGITSFNDLPGNGPAVACSTQAWTHSTLPNTMQCWVQYGYYGFEQVRRFKSDITFPFEFYSFMFHRSILYFSDTKTLLATGYGKRAGSAYNEAIVLKSTDYGKSWTYLATAVKQETFMTGSEGPSEPVMVQLTNGNLLMVVRNGDIGEPDPQPANQCPMYYAISTNRGQTWSTPVSLGVPGVGMDMQVLDDGRVVLSYGRPNVYLKVADGTGTTWGNPITIYEGAGSGYTGLRKDANGDLLLIYNESDFASGQFGLYPGSKNYMKMVKIAVIKPCQNNGYKLADLNKDCTVSIKDYAQLAADWLK